MRDKAFELYREKIVARKCLNALIDIRLGLSRQNKLLEILINELQEPEEISDLLK